MSTITGLPTNKASFPTNMPINGGPPHATRVQLPQAVQNSLKVDTTDAVSTAAIVFVVVGLVILAVVILNIVGSVAAVKFINRKDSLEGSKVAAGMFAAGGWLFFPFSIVPIVMEGKAKAKDKAQAGPTNALRKGRH